MSYSSESFMVSKETLQLATKLSYEKIERQKKAFEDMKKQFESYKEKVTEQSKEREAD